MLTIEPFGVDPLEEDAPNIIASGEALLSPIGPFSDITGILDSTSGVGIRVRLDQPISDIVGDSNTASSLSNYYTSIKELLQTNSFTFDDSANPGPDMSMTFETMDNEIFTKYNSDSAV